MVKFRKIVESTHYDEIVKMLIDGYTPKDVSAYLKNEYNESIGYRSLHDFRKSELNIKNKVNQKFLKEAKKELKEKARNNAEKHAIAEAEIVTAINKGVNVRKLLNIIIESGEEIWNKLLNDLEIPLDTKMKLVMEAGKQEKDWIKNEDTNIEINYNGLSGLANAISESKKRNNKK